MKEAKSYFFILFVIVFAEVNSQSIVTYKYNDLEFGDIFIGYTETILNSDERAAQFYFYHNKFIRADLLVTFKLPSFLTNGIHTIPIKFASNSGAWSRYNRQSGRTIFNPNSPLEIRNALFYIPIYIWLGGSISSNSGISPGNYNGSITLTIEFL
ncbi:MAG: hypothetical protein IPM32_17330 [Ignavibacteriae bacterium]|nr:hypothetical protein [Ignavibacteriota bacterium]